MKDLNKERMEETTNEGASEKAAGRTGTLLGMGGASIPAKAPAAPPSAAEDGAKAPGAPPEAPSKKGAKAPGEPPRASPKKGAKAPGAPPKVPPKSGAKAPGVPPKCPAIVFTAVVGGARRRLLVCPPCQSESTRRVSGGGDQMGDDARRWISDVVCICFWLSAVGRTLQLFSDFQKGIERVCVTVCVPRVVTCVIV